jgi:lysozyme
MQPVPANGPTVPGFDVSHWEPKINWNQVMASKQAFAFFKATEGTSNVDPTFQTNWKSAKAAGIRRGAYHFFHPSQDPNQQAKLFAKTVGLLDEDDLIVIDWETSDNVPGNKDLAAGIMCLETMQDLCGSLPGIYGSPYFLDNLGGNVALAKYWLWIAHYGVDAPLVPAPWSKWTFWQTGEKGQVPGIGACDVNVFNGNLTQLEAFSTKIAT